MEEAGSSFEIHSETLPGLGKVALLPRRRDVWCWVLDGTEGCWEVRCQRRR